jgi:nucleoside 2-deoxyribosyltransferase
MKNRIYLAGTIYKEEPAKSWKIKLQKLFSNNDLVEFVDPKPEMEADLSMVAKDKYSINSCNIFVAYIERPSFGTAMEIYHAFLQNDKPVIIINPNLSCRGDIWVEAHSHVIVDNIEDAAQYIESLLI